MKQPPSATPLSMNSLAIESQPTAQLKETLKHERAQPDGGDKDLIRILVHILGRRALGMDDDAGFPRVLKDDESDGLPF